MSVMATALITGGTAGLGRGFAEAFAQQGFDLVLVARNQARLDEVGQELHRLYGVTVSGLAADLTQRAGMAIVEDRLSDPAGGVDVLVNNAGFGLKAGFLESTMADEQALLDILVTAPMRLTHAALPGMIGRGMGSIINVSSMAGWITAGTYSAAKAWLTTFTEGLSAELHGTGVTATVVCPGFVHTEFHERSGIHAPRLPGLFWLDVDQVVGAAVEDARKGRLVSVPSRQYQALSVLAKYSPRPIVRKASTMRRR